VDLVDAQKLKKFYNKAMMVIHTDKMVCKKKKFKKRFILIDWGAPGTTTLG
jgi:hypothetical protein